MVCSTLVAAVTQRFDMQVSADCLVGMHSNCHINHIAHGFQIYGHRYKLAWVMESEGGIMNMPLFRDALQAVRECSLRAQKCGTSVSHIDDRPPRPDMSSDSQRGKMFRGALVQCQAWGS